MTFGEKLQKLRARAGLSQDQLAELLDVSRQSVSKWERSEAMPEAEKLVRISRQFGVSTDYLLLEEREEPETARAQTPAGLWGRIKQWYRNKGYLLAWILVAWGGVRLLREIADTVNFFAELLEFNDPTPEFWKANLMSAFVPDAIPPVLMSATGVVLALWGRRMEGRLRWYHLGWLPMLLGLVGTGFALPWPLRFGNGLVWWISAALLAVSPENAGKFLLSGLWINLVCLLISGLGLAILLLGRRYDRRSPSGKTE